MRDAETTLAILQDRGSHCHVTIHRGTLTERLRALIRDGKLTPTGDWVLPEEERPAAGNHPRPTTGATRGI